MNSGHKKVFVMVNRSYLLYI